MAKSRRSVSGIVRIFYNLSAVDSSARKLQKKLKLAGMPDNPKVLVAKSFTGLFFSSIFSIILAVLGVIFLLKFKYTGEHTFIFLSFITFILSAFLPVITYLFSTIGISHRIAVRKYGIDAETPAFSALMLVFLRSGLSIRLLFENVSNSSTFIYVRDVGLYVLKRMKYFGESVEKALTETTQTVPSEAFNKLITAYTTAIETGVPIYESMRAKVVDVMKEIELKATNTANTLSTLGSGYIIWLSSGFIMFLLLLVLRAVFPLLSGLSIGLLGVIAVVFIPLVNVIFIWMVDQIQLKFPEKTLRADKLFLYLFPLGFILGLILMAIIEIIISKLPGQIPVSPEYMIIDLFTLNGNTSMIPATLLGFTLGFTIVSIPPYLSAKKELSVGTGYDTYIATFLRAVAEGIRSGIPPEKILENLKDAEGLGKFRNILEKITALADIGYPLKDAFRKASETIIDFPTRIAFSSLADMMEIGSLTPETIDILAEQIETQVRIKREYYSKIKVMKYILYAGTILVLVATVLLSSIIFSLIHGQSSAFLLEAAVLVPRAIYITSVASVFNAVTAGLLIGKMATGRVSNGYSHVVFLLVITTALIIISLMIRFSFTTTAPTL